MHFTEDLKKCDFLGYLGDNPGEIIFDKLLIEAIKERYDIDVVFMVVVNNFLRILSTNLSIRY